MRIRAGEHDLADMVARPGFKSGKKNRKRKKKKSLVHLKVQEEEHKDDNYNSNNNKSVGDDRFVMLILAASIAAKRDFDRDFNFRDFEAYGLDLSQKKLRCFCNSFLLGTQNKKRRKNCCSPAPAPAPVQMGRGNLEPENKDSVRANVKNNDAAEAPGSEGTPGRVWGRRNNKNMAAEIEEEAAAAVEFESRCKRRNGRGWRCKERTMMGYSLCEYHLHKSARFKSLGGTISSFCKAKNDNTNSNKCKKHLKQQQKKSLNEISV